VSQLTGPALAWDVHSPPAPVADGEAGWLQAVEAFRGRVLYDGGRRPRFRDADGSFADPDPADGDAYHVVASAGDDIVGCFRVIPLARSSSGLCERLLGTDELEGVLDRLGVEREEAAEGGGWAVDPAYRKHGLGIRLWAMGVALSERLGMDVVLGAAGTRYGQFRLLARTGVRPVPGLDGYEVPEYADELQLVFYEPPAATPRFRALVDEAAERLPCGLGPAHHEVAG
jgi:hypothetical protein